MRNLGKDRSDFQSRLYAEYYVLIYLPRNEFWSLYRVGELQ